MKRIKLTSCFLHAKISTASKATNSAPPTPTPTKFLQFRTQFYPPGPGIRPETRKFPKNPRVLPLTGLFYCLHLFLRNFPPFSAKKTPAKFNNVKLNLQRAVFVCNKIANIQDKGNIVINLLEKEGERFAPLKIFRHIFLQNFVYTLFTIKGKKIIKKGSTIYKAL